MYAPVNDVNLCDESTCIIYYVYFFRCYIVVICNAIYNIAPELIILFARPHI